MPFGFFPHNSILQEPDIAGATSDDQVLMMSIIIIISFF